MQGTDVMKERFEFMVFAVKQVTERAADLDGAPGAASESDLKPCRRAIGPKLREK